MIKIGDVEITGKVFCAPLAGITNLVYRKIAKEFGASLTYTEMVSDKSLVYENKKILELIQIDKEEHPISLQLFGGEKKFLVDAVEILNKISDADILDINMGCPIPKVLKSKAGSYWLKDPQEAYEKVKAIVDVSNKPVSVKLRLGWDKDNINVVEVAKLMEKAGVKLIVVHGRTKTQLYSGLADYSYIKEVKKAVKIPVVGNGDIKSIDDAIRMFDETGCDAIMIGRGALGNPWLFKQIDHYLKTKERLPGPTLKEIVTVCLKHAAQLCKLKGEEVGIKEMRSHVCWYLKGQKNSNEIKSKVNEILKLEELNIILNNYLSKEDDLDENSNGR